MRHKVNQKLPIVVTFGMWRIAEQDAVRRRLALGGGDACASPDAATSEMVGYRFWWLGLRHGADREAVIVMAVIGLVGLVSTVVYLLRGAARRIKIHGPPGAGDNPPAAGRHCRSGAPLYVGRQSRPSSRRGAGATANGACCNGRGRPDRLRVDGRVRAAKTHTDGRAMGTSKGVEATSFSEQAPAARRIRARGSLTLRAFWRGCSRCRRRVREVHGAPGGARVMSRRGT